MSKTLDQIFIANPITSNASTDLMYFSQSPYSANHDAAMTYANFALQFASSALTTNFIYIGVANVATASQTLPTAVQGNITQIGAQSQALHMNTHLINGVVDPVNPQDAATKNSVYQTALNGTSVYAASAATLGTVTQSGAGVGATLTNAGVQATFALDGVNPPCWFKCIN